MTGRIIISATSGSGAKTLVSLGLCAKWQEMGKKVAPFKKGPDYIDASWLTSASGAVCRHLDVWMMGEKNVKASFAQYSKDSDIALIEGNRGLYDGVDTEGTYSTGQLAKILDAPVILIINCKKMTGTTAAIVKGCKEFLDIKIGGVILNRIAGKRHERVVRQGIEKHTGIPVVGVIPDLGEFGPSERYLGLLPPEESGKDLTAEMIADAKGVITKHVDYEKIFEIACHAQPKASSSHAQPKASSSHAQPKASSSHAQPKASSRHAQPKASSRHAQPKASSRHAQPKASGHLRIGVIKDAAFQFYYPENIEELERCGAEIVELSALSSSDTDGVDGLYIGGGFPEQFLGPLSMNRSFLDSVRQMADEGKPIYAECGGAMYLGKSIWKDETAFPMTGVFPVEYSLQKKPVGHGYSIIKASKDNPFFKIGQELKGHEFHYSNVRDWGSGDYTMSFDVERGHGFDGKHEGLTRKNVFATYTHTHVLTENGASLWAKALVKKARGN